jgi:O-antigen ligase
VRDALVRASAFSFLLLALALPWSVAPISITLVLCAALTLIVWLMPGGPRWVRTPVDLPALAWIAALMIASLFAMDPRASWPRVAKGFLLVLVPVAAYHARDPKMARGAIAVLFASAGLAAIFALARFVAQGPEFPNRVKGAVGHPLTYGGQALLIATVATAIAIRGRGRWRVGALLLLGVLLPALAGTYTRSAWIGYLAAVAVILAFTRARWLAGMAGGIAAVAVVLPGVYRERAFSIFDPQSPWNRERVHMWGAGLRMVRDHPWTGVGLQDLHTLYEQYKPQGAVEPAGHLHSVYVQVGATMGLLGLLALLFLLVGLMRAASRAFRELRRSPETEARFGAALSLGVSAALVGFMVSGLMEWNLGDEELLDLLCVLVGIAFAQSLGASAKRRLNQATSPLSPMR